MSKHKISKSRYLKGLQCQKLLWWAVHDREAEELKPDLVTEHRFATGHRVGELARKQFPDGDMVENTENFEEWIKNTSDAMEQCKDVIYEAAFSNELAFVAVDILQRSDDKWNVIEVKSSLDAKDTHIDDLIIQCCLLEQMGIPIDRTEVMTLNRDCTYPDLDNLFKRHDVTDRVRERLDEAKPNLLAFQNSLSGDIPEIKIGKHCDSPYECPFKSRCWPKLPEHHISTLYRIGKSKAFDLENDMKISEVNQLTDEIELSAIQQRQIRAVKANELVLSQGLQRELDRLQYPIAYLDFETIMPAIPMFTGDRPYQIVPVQFSCHLEQAPDDLTHFEWIAHDQSDPRKGMVLELLKACEPATTIVAYNAKFEKQCIERIAQTVPEYSKRLLALNEKFVDLLPMVRNHIYHPAFKGSFSIKKVLPALVPSLRYDDLEIADGMTASVMLQKLINGDLPNEIDQTVLITDLKKYCKLDTQAMVELRKAMDLVCG